MLEKDQIEKYLERIHYHKPIQLNKNLLDQLQTKHYQMIPYENIDILMNRPLKLDWNSLFEKIVLKHRGGYCFELNGLYGYLLRGLGFHAEDYMARFLLNEPSIPMRRHRVIVAEAEGQRYLCDVGIGIEAPRQALLLDTNQIQKQPFGTYKIERDNDLGHVLYEQYHGEWRPYYSFTEEKQLDLDYVMPSFYCEKHPDSIFNKEMMLSIKTKEGRNTIDGNIFKIFSNQDVTVREITTILELSLILKEHFRIEPSFF